MQARLYLTSFLCGLAWYWELKPLSGMPATIGGGADYTGEVSARQTAKRWAKKHNIEIVDGDA
jgi:hypothetical protein